MYAFLNISVLQGGVVSTSSNPQAGGPPLVGCPRLLIQFIRSYPPYRRPFLYLQPEDVPRHGGRDLLLLPLKFRLLMIIYVHLLVCHLNQLQNLKKKSKNHALTHCTVSCPSPHNKHTHSDSREYSFIDS